MVKRISVFASVVLFGFLAIVATPSVLMAAKPKHHHAAAERQRRLQIAVRENHIHRTASRPLQHMSRSQRKHLLSEIYANEIRLRKQIIATKELERQIYMAEHPSKQVLLARARAYHLHQEMVAANRREILAEENGDISSKSIRAWQAYITQVPVRLISVDLNDPGVKVSALLAHNGIGSAEPFSHMIRRTQPDVAVTGTFFSLDNLRPVGDIVINGGLAYFGGMGTALCITRDNQAQMITVPWGRHHDWSNYDFVMACGPRLLQDHEIVLDPLAERFRDKHMLSPNSRIGVGITATNKLIFVMTKDPIYLGRLAKIMRELGCSQAMNLDAGTSTGFYYEGNMMASPGRWLTNAIVVYANQHRTIASAS